MVSSRANRTVESHRNSHFVKKCQKLGSTVTKFVYGKYSAGAMFGTTLNDQSRGHALPEASILGLQQMPGAPSATATGWQSLTAFRIGVAQSQCGTQIPIWDSNMQAVWLRPVYMPGASTHPGQTAYDPPYSGSQPNEALVGAEPQRMPPLYSNRPSSPITSPPLGYSMAPAQG